MNASQAAAFLGRLGGTVTSKAKTKAVRENGKLGGRPRTHPVCKNYDDRSHRFSKKTGRCACGYEKP
jgi:hypothetical protein